nr:hypothetical protein [Olsenella sp. Marseille-P4559]
MNVTDMHCVRIKVGRIGAVRGCGIRIHLVGEEHMKASPCEPKVHAASA